MHELYVFPWTRGAAAEREASVVGELATALQNTLDEIANDWAMRASVLISFRLSAS